MILDSKAGSDFLGFEYDDGGCAAFIEEITHNSQENPVDLDWCGFVKEADFFFSGDIEKCRDLIRVGG